MRYGDTLTSLEITSVTTSYELDAGINFSRGATLDIFKGTSSVPSNIVSGGAVASFSNKPTITYVPVRGDELQRTMLEPIPPLKILKSLQTFSQYSDSLLPYCIGSINGWRSRMDCEFYQICRLYMDLSRRGVIRITVKEPAEPKVTKVPEEYTIHMNPAEPEQKKNCEDSTGKKKKQDSAVAFLVVDKDHAKHLDRMYKFEDSKDSVDENEERRPKNKDDVFKCNDLKDCVRKCIRACPNDEHFSDCVYGHLWSFGIEANDPECTTIIDSYTKNAINTAITGCHGEDDLTEHLSTILEQVTLTQKVNKLTGLLWPECEKVNSCSNKCERSGQHDVYEIINGNEEPPCDPCCKKISLETRSILQTLVLLSDGIDLPPESSAETVKIWSHRLGEFSKLHIRSAPTPPEDAFVAVNYHGCWFYIENRDIRSKVIFSSILGILAMAETGTSTGVPILTLPVQ